MSWDKPKLRKLEKAFDIVGHCYDMEALKVKEQIETLHKLVEEMNKKEEPSKVDQKEAIRQELLKQYKEYRDALDSDRH